MVPSRVGIYGGLLLALLMCSPAPLNGQYTISRTVSTFQTPPTKEASAVPASTAAPSAATVAAAAIPAATTAPSRAAVASAKPVPAATKAPTPIPTVPKPVTVMNTDTSNATSTDDTALYSVLRIIGSGVTPFNLARQSTLLTALGQVISTVDFSNIYITDVNPVYASRRRQLLMEADAQQEMVLGPRRALLASSYNNQADVTVQMIAGSSTTVPDTLTELNSSISNGTLDTQLQNLGQSSWAVQLLNTTITTPNSINATSKDYCRDQFGHWCLDKHKHLSSSGVRGVIAGGIIGIICIAALALILKDLHGARKLQGHEVVYNPQTPNLGGGATPANGKGVVGGVPLSAHAGSPTGHSPTAVGYTGGLAPVGQKIRRKSGAFTSGAVTHPASLAAAGKPTGLEEMVSSPSFSRSNTPNQTPTANQRHH
uniref:Putative extracellular protein TR9_093 n=1 Tax=Trebouxia lynnae TaxID=1825957 RepID=A0A7L9QEM9_9CHLO|nr:putative extracellular protein TR9_093 [Trebouxia lynnae]